MTHRIEKQNDLYLSKYVYNYTDFETWLKSWRTKQIYPPRIWISQYNAHAFKSTLRMECINPNDQKSYKIIQNYLQNTPHMVLPNCFTYL